MKNTKTYCLLDMLVTCKLAKSRREARQLINDGAIEVNGKKAVMVDGILKLL